MKEDDGLPKAKTGCHHPYSKRSYKPRPKATATKRCNLVTLTRAHREVSQPRKVNVGPLPEAIQKNWLTTLRAKEVEATASSWALAPTQPADVPANQSPNSSLSLDTKYCAICTPVGKLCPNDFLCLKTGKKILRKKKEMTRIKER